MRTKHEIIDYLTKHKANTPDKSNLIRIQMLNWVLEESDSSIQIQNVFIPQHDMWEKTEFQFIAESSGYVYLCWENKIYQTSIFIDDPDDAFTGLTLDDLI